MSLWYENLSLELYDWGDNQVQRAKCILAHLSMPVPRSWWEQALKTGRVQRAHASLLNDLEKELSESAGYRDAGKLLSSYQKKIFVFGDFLIPDNRVAGRGNLI